MLNCILRKSASIPVIPGSNQKRNLVSTAQMFYTSNLRNHDHVSCNEISEKKTVFLFQDKYSYLNGRGRFIACNIATQLPFYLNAPNSQRFEHSYFISTYNPIYIFIHTCLYVLIIYIHVRYSEFNWSTINFLSVVLFKVAPSHGKRAKRAPNEEPKCNYPVF